MKLTYFPDSDSLYIAFNPRPGIDSLEIVDGMVVDVDEQGTPVGIDIQITSVSRRQAWVTGDK